MRKRCEILKVREIEKTRAVTGPCNTSCRVSLPAYLKRITSHIYSHGVGLAKWVCYRNKGSTKQ